MIQLPLFPQPTFSPIELIGIRDANVKPHEVKAITSYCGLFFIITHDGREIEVNGYEGWAWDYEPGMEELKHRLLRYV